MMPGKLRVMLVIGGGILIVAGVIRITYIFGNGDIETASGNLVVLPEGAYVAPFRTRHQPAQPLVEGVHAPPVVSAALGLGAGAVLREPLPQNARGIVCGEVSPSGHPADFRRFVYNASGGTGGIDDGTEVFRKFADKICLLQSAR